MLEVYCGCMFSGKSTKARLEALRAAANNIRVITPYFTLRLLTASHLTEK